MRIEEIRIYSEVLEQGVDFKNYIKNIISNISIKNIYTKKGRGEFTENDSIIDRIRKVKDIDVLITSLSEGKEFPLLLIEYSTAVPTDDHKMQRSDVYYWSSIFKTPMMKISPVSKGMDQDFGGGSKFTDELEVAMACKRNAILYHIPWQNEKEKNTLSVKSNALSCISHSNDITTVLSNIINCFANVASFDEYFRTLQTSYMSDNKCALEIYTDEAIKNIISESARFNWFHDKLRVKINRFGHAMDPDRGVLYFVNMLLGAKNIITEIQVNRSYVYNSRGGYSSLFDGLSKKDLLESYVRELIEDGNIFSDENAIYIFKAALNIDDALQFTKVNEHNYIIKDDNLSNFLKTFPSMSTKSIFFLSTELQLTDKNRKIICSIKWNSQPIENFVNSIANTNYYITNLSTLTNKTAKEDLITYASVELYKKIQCKLLAVSYPGAQGDRCVLTGSGRNVIRTYVDIIAYKNSSNGINVFLEECKEKFSNSFSDVEKLNTFKTIELKKNGLKELFRKTVDISDFSNLYTSVAGKSRANIPNFDVDYIFMFDIDDSCEKLTKINYSVAIIDTTLIEDFSVLKDHRGKLKGTIEVDKIYVIEQ